MRQLTLFLAACCCCAPLFAQRAAEFESRPATALENDKVELLVDLGVTPPARAERGALALVVARAVLVSAQSAAAAPGRPAPSASSAIGANATPPCRSTPTVSTCWPCSPTCCPEAVRACVRVGST